MKKVVRTLGTMALIAVMSAGTFGCQKEQIIAPQSLTMPIVYYTVDGVSHTASLPNDEAWANFIDIMFTLAEEGHSVSFRDGSTVNCFFANKEVVTYTTEDRHDAEEWADNMRSMGFTVSIEYNKLTGIYTCTAIR